MKHVKMLALAAVAAMALTAFLGASSASATVLCKTTLTTGCAAAGWDYPAGTNLVLSADGSLELTDTSHSFGNTCTVSNIEGTTANTGSSTETVRGNTATKAEWGSCTNEPTTTTQKGTLEIHYISDNPNTTGREMGTITASGWKVTTKAFGFSCVYETGTGDDLGELTDVTNTGNGTATADVHAVVTTKTFGCPSTGLWEGHYWVTSPNPLYVSES